MEEIMENVTKNNYIYLFKTYYNDFSIKNKQNR